MPFTFVNVNGFTPNTRVNWVSVGKVTSWTRAGSKVRLVLATPGMTLEISFLGTNCFRVRFRPVTAPDYTIETSAAVVDRDLGLSPAALTVTGDSTRVTADTGAITVLIDLDPYRIQVLRGGQLISADDPKFNVVYVPKSVDPANEVIANFKIYPANAKYCGFGSKAGAQLFKNQCTMTFFNFDNFSYSKGFIPGGQGGPLNPTEPLYCSIPLLLEVNPQPVGDFSGPPYAYGIFFDNPSQSFINIGASDYSTSMFGLYYFGALHGEMDYYFMAGSNAGEVLAQYTTLTGRAPMPPKYVFGYHQGGYGYFDHYHLSAAANAYRAARFPIDGLHVDVDFQDNYRTFTHSEKKFPNVRAYLDVLHSNGFKCSTNITPMLNRSDLDENANMAPYAERDVLQAAGALLAQRFDGDTSPTGTPSPYVGQEDYGVNHGNNPFPTFPPPAKPGQLGAFGYYSDYSRAAFRQLWGDQYRHLINDVGIDMIWQDMTCPAIRTSDGDFLNPSTFPLNLIQSPDGQPQVPHAKIHNQYALQLLQATWEGIQRLRKAVANHRNFIIARGGYAGMQRYAALWTGDCPSSWEYLSILVPQVLNIGLSGVPISGADVGGFANGSSSSPSSFFAGNVYGGITDPELFTRWMHLGAFLPWYRNHYNGYEKQYQEPYAYGEPVLSNCRKYVELRYRMIQIFYDAMFDWTRSGMPICRALFLNDPHDLAAYDWVDSEFFVGLDLLVAPILTQGNPNRDVYLPTGSDWYSFKDNRAKLEPPVSGGSRFTYFAPLDLVPLYVRAGAILPMREVEQYIGELARNPLTINIYPGPDRSYILYQDDGISFDAQDRQRFRITELSHQGLPGGQKVRVRRTFDQYAPPELFYFVAFPGTRHPVSVSFGDSFLPDVGSPENLVGSLTEAYYWNASIEVTFVKVFDTAPDVTLTVLF